MEHGTLLNVIWQPGWEGVWGRMDTCIFMAKSLLCLPEITTMLFISYMPIQNVFGVKIFFKGLRLFEIFSPENMPSWSFIRAVRRS